MNIQKTENILALSLMMALIAAVSAGILACFDYITRKPRLEAEQRETTAALKLLQPDLNNDPDSGKIFFIRQADGQWLRGNAEQAEKKPVECVTFYPAVNDGKLISVIGKAISPKGYGGDMTIMASLKPDGTIENVMVTRNKETPGLGTVVTNRTREKTIADLFSHSRKNNGSRLPPNRILDQFKGMAYEPDQSAVAETAASGATPKTKDNTRTGGDRRLIPASRWKVKKDGGDMAYVTGATISSRAVVYGVKKIVSVYYAVRKQVLAEFARENKR